MTRTRLFSAGLVALAALSGTPAGAQVPPTPLGIPQAGGVPGLSGPPDWTAAQPPLAKLIDDPRWVGAAGVAHGGNAASAALADFRALHDNGTLHLSWMVRFDPRVWSPMDRLYVGFAHPDKNSAAPAVLLSVKLTTAANLVASRATTDREVLWFTRGAAGGWTESPAVATAWAEKDTAVWINDPNGRSDKSENNGTFWAIHVRVPVLKSPVAADVPSKGVPGDSDGKLLLWYSLLNWFGTNDDPAVHQMPFPSGSPVTNPEGLAGPANLGIPDPYVSDAAPAPERKWAPVRLRKAGDNPTDYSNTGIDIAWDDVGVLKNTAAPLPATVPPNLGHEVQFPKTVNDPAVSNLFVARPTNGTAAPIPATKLQARFRIANWGSQVGFASPDQSLWETLKAENNAVPVNDADIPVYDPVQKKKAEIRFYWEAKPTNPLVQDFMGPTPKRSRHQCVLFEMAGNGADFPFVKTSLYKNMDFVDASLFTRTAAVSVAGLPAVADGAAKRDVFLLVRTFGMPTRVGAPPPDVWPQPTPKSPGPVSVPVLPPKGVPRDVPRIAKEGQPGVAKEPRDKTLYPQAVVRMLGSDPEAGKPKLPSYTVFAWHDTGRTLTVDGIKARVVEPQTAFGYYVNHNGPLDGWRHALKGAEKIGPDFYKVSPPTGGSVDVVTEIEALESGPILPPGGPCPQPVPCYCPPVCVPQCPPMPICVRQPVYYRPCPPSPSLLPAYRPVTFITPYRERPRLFFRR